MPFADLVGDETTLRGWLSARNRAFVDRTPLDVVVEGEADLLWKMVYEVRQGTFA